MSEQHLPLIEQPEVAGFVSKTYQILSNDQYARIVYWGANGKQFVIKDITKFQEMVLPKYFRHKKINSFIRQLNMYGFHKSRKQNTKSIFSHPYFIKGRQDLLKSIKRKVRVSQNEPTTPVKNQSSINDPNMANGNINEHFHLPGNNISNFGISKKYENQYETPYNKNSQINTPSTIKQQYPSLRFYNNNICQNLFQNHDSFGYDLNAREFLDSKQCLKSRLNLNFINFNCASLRKVSQNYLGDIINGNIEREDYQYGHNGNQGQRQQKGYNSFQEKDQIISIQNGIDERNAEGDFIESEEQIDEIQIETEKDKNNKNLASMISIVIENNSMTHLNNDKNQNKIALDGKKSSNETRIDKNQKREMEMSMGLIKFDGPSHFLLPNNQEMNMSNNRKRY